MKILSIRRESIDNMSRSDCVFQVMIDEHSGWRFIFIVPIPWSRKNRYLLSDQRHVPTTLHWYFALSRFVWPEFEKNFVKWRSVCGFQAEKIEDA